MQFDRSGRAIDGGSALDDIGIQRPLSQVLGSRDLQRFFLEALDKGVANATPFFLWLGDSRQRR